MHCVRNQFFRDRKGLQPSALVAWTREDDQKEVCQFKSIGDRQCDDLSKQARHNEKMIPSKI